MLGTGSVFQDSNELITELKKKKRGVPEQLFFSSLLGPPLPIFKVFQW